MRSAVLACLVACSSGDSGPTPCTQRHEIAISDVSQIAVEDTTLLIASERTLTAVHLDGSPPTRLATATAVRVGSHGGRAFYAIGLDAIVEVHARDGSVLATIPGQDLYDLRVNATDVYVLTGNATAAQLWRVPRDASTQAVSIATLPPAIRRLELGATIAGVIAVGSDGSMLSTVPIPDGGPPTSVPIGPGSIFFVRDAAFRMFVNTITSHAYELTVDRVLPTAAGVIGGLRNNEIVTVFHDDRYLYLGNIQLVPSYEPDRKVPDPTMTAIDPITLARHGSATCTDFMPIAAVAYDDTQLYGVQTMENGSAILIAPRAP